MLVTFQTGRTCAKMFRNITQDCQSPVEFWQELATETIDNSYMSRNNTLWHPPPPGPFILTAEPTLFRNYLNPHKVHSAKQMNSKKIKMTKFRSLSSSTKEKYHFKKYITTYWKIPPWKVHAGITRWEGSVK